MIRKATRADTRQLVLLRSCLWPQAPAREHRDDLDAFFRGEAREPLAILVSQTPARELTGFCELSIRAYAQACATDRVGYLEGWYVAPAYRRQGVGRSLLAAADNWARKQGCLEFASDAESENLISIEAHEALGFEDAGTIRCFRKSL